MASKQSKRDKNENLFAWNEAIQKLGEMGYYDDYNRKVTPVRDNDSAPTTETEKQTTKPSLEQQVQPADPVGEQSCESVHQPKMLIVTGVRRNMIDEIDYDSTARLVYALTGKESYHVIRYFYPEDGRDNYDLLRWIRHLMKNVITKSDIIHVVVTCASYIINEIGRRIREKDLSPDDVLVAINDRQNIVCSMRYTNKGQMPDWPYGFYYPDYGQVTQVYESVWYDKEKATDLTKVKTLPYTVKNNQTHEQK